MYTLICICICLNIFKSLVVEAFTEQSMFESPFTAQSTEQSTEQSDVFDPEKPSYLKSNPNLRGFDRARRGSVSAESYDPSKGSSQSPLSIPKTGSERARLQEALDHNLMMKGLPEQTRAQILEAMFERKVRAGEDIIVQGDIGDNFYVVEAGSFSVLIEGKGEVNRAGPGQSFGELALMYNQPRQATVRAMEDSVVWGLDGATFRKVIIDIAYRRRMLHKDLLGKVPLFATLNPAEVARIAEALVPISYTQGETILRQGDLGQEFFIIAQGQTSVTMHQADESDAQQVNELGPGDFFGELALLTNAPRSATVTALTPVQCLVLSRADFNRLMGPLLPYLERNREHYKKYEKYITAQ